MLRSLRIKIHSGDVFGNSSRGRDERQGVHGEMMISCGTWEPKNIAFDAEGDAADRIYEGMTGESLSDSNDSVREIDIASILDEMKAAGKEIITITFDSVAV